MRNGGAEEHKPEQKGVTFRWYVKWNKRIFEKKEKGSVTSRENKGRKKSKWG